MRIVFCIIAAVGVVLGIHAQTHDAPEAIVTAPSFSTSRSLNVRSTDHTIVSEYSDFAAANVGTLQSNLIGVTITGAVVNVESTNRFNFPGGVTAIGGTNLNGVLLTTNGALIIPNRSGFALITATNIPIGGFALQSSNSVLWISTTADGATRTDYHTP